MTNQSGQEPGTAAAEVEVNETLIQSQVELGTEDQRGIESNKDAVQLAHDVAAVIEARQLKAAEIMIQSIADRQDRDQCCIEAAKQAASKGQFESVNFLLHQVADQTSQDSLRLKLAMCAAERRQWEIVPSLLERISNQDFKDSSCLEVARLAIGSKEWKVVFIIIEVITDSSVRDLCSIEASEAASTNGFSNEVASLRNLVDSSTQAGSRLTVVFKFLAVEASHGIVRDDCRRLSSMSEALEKAEGSEKSRLSEILNAEKPDDLTYVQAVKFASAKGYLNEVIFFLDRIVCGEKRREGCMVCAEWSARFARIEVVKSLLQRCSAVESLKHACCMKVAEIAVCCGHFDLTKLAIKTIDDAVVRDQCCLTVAKLSTVHRHKATIEFIVESIHCEKQREQCCASLTEPAARNKWLEVVEFLVQRIRDQMLKDECCTTAAKSASYTRAWPVVKYLLDCIRSQKLKDKCCATAAESAAWSGDSEETLEFLNNIVNEHVKNQAHIRAVESAASNLQDKVVKSLVMAVSNETLKDRCSSRVAKYFVNDEYLDFIKFLVSAISDRESRNQCCLSAIELAALHNHTKVVEFLVDRVDEPSVRQQCRLKAAEFSAQGGHPEVVNNLLASEVDPVMSDKLRISAARASAEAGRVEAMSAFLGCIADKARRDECQRSCALIGASLCNENVVQLCKIQPQWVFESQQFVRFLSAMALKDKNSILVDLLDALQDIQVMQLLCLTISLGDVALALKLIINHRFNRELVDAKVENGATALILAAEAGHHEIIDLLLDVGASVSAVDDQGRTALTRACEAGHMRAAKTLLDKGANPNHRDHRVLTCAQLAKRFGHTQLLLLLYPLSLRTEDVSRAKMLSMDLRELLRKSGFTLQRAKCQQVMADILQRMWIVLCRDDRQISGSYAEGWANSLVRVNGRTGADSDIDCTVLLEGLELHLDGGCKRLRHECATANQVAVKKGHAQVPVGSGSQPANTAAACGIRPAHDLCIAIQCCSGLGNSVEKLYNSKLNLPLQVHLVNATRPQPDFPNELRVSFSFHEKFAMRNLSEIQGQLFTIIKFCFKRYLPVTLKTPGLKTYHAKTLLLFMLQKHGVEEWREAWQPQNLIARLKESLDMMLSFIDDPNSSPDECMPHFFMPDAPLYFKNAGLGGSFDNTKTRVRERLFELRCDIDEFIEQIKGHMKPLQTEKFYFHPFTLLPLTPLSTATAVRSRRQDQYMHLCDVYCVVHQCLQGLQSKDCSRDDLMRQLSLIDQLQWCRCTVSCLTAMVHLKFDEVQQAEVVLTDLMAHAPQGAWKPEQFLRGLAMDWEAPVDSDWAWRFCFPADTPPSLPFLPEFTQTLFTARLSKPRSEHLYVNFRCLSWSLQAELLRNRTAIDFDAWLSELQEDPDLEELLTLAHYSNQLYQLSFCKQQIDLITSMRRFAVETQDEEKIRWVSEKLERIRQADFSRI